MGLLSGGKLSGGYIGSSNPKAIDGLHLWLDGDDINTFTFRGGSTVYVQQIDDKSGNGRHATQITEIAQPTLLYNELNGRNVVHFPAFGYQLNFANNSFPYGDSSYTYFLIVKAADVNSSHQFIQSGSNATRQKFFLRFLSNVFQHDWYGDALVGDTVYADTWHVCYADYDGTTRQSIVDGGSKYSDVPSAPCQNTGNNTAILSNWDDTYHAELIIYNRALSNAERALIEQYLSTKWGI